MGLCDSNQITKQLKKLCCVLAGVSKQTREVPRWAVLSKSTNQAERAHFIMNRESVSLKLLLGEISQVVALGRVGVLPLSSGTGGPEVALSHHL